MFGRYQSPETACSAVPSTLLGQLYFNCTCLHECMLAHLRTQSAGLGIAEIAYKTQLVTISGGASDGMLVSGWRHDQ